MIWVWDGDNTFACMDDEDAAAWNAETFPRTIYFFAELVMNDE